MEIGEKKLRKRKSEEDAYNIVKVSSQYNLYTKNQLHMRRGKQKFR